MLRTHVRTIGLAVVLALPATQAVYSDQGGGDPPAKQPCNGGSVVYEAPAGVAGGSGSTPKEASGDAAHNAGLAVNAYCTPCDNCPNGQPCGPTIAYDWHGYVMTPAIFDATLNRWLVGVTWSGCTMTQWCHDC